MFDPLGFLAPVTIQGRLLLRDFTCQEAEWDSPLPEGMYKEWEIRVQSLHKAQSSELHVFSDASGNSSVVYL